MSKTPKLVLVSAAAVMAAVIVATPVRAQAASADRDDAQTSAQHERKRVERERIESLEHEFQQAQLTGDVAAMDKLLSDDYLGVNANGELSTKAQQLDHMRNRTLSLTRLDPSDVKIKVIGTTAIVNSEVQVEGVLDGSPLRGRYRYTRVYQRLPNGSWKVTSFEATRIRRPGAPA